MTRPAFRRSSERYRTDVRLVPVAGKLTPNRLEFQHFSIFSRNRMNPEPLGREASVGRKGLRSADSVGATSGRGCQPPAAVLSDLRAHQRPAPRHRAARSRSNPVRSHGAREPEEDEERRLEGILGFVFIAQDRAAMEELRGQPSVPTSRAIRRMTGFRSPRGASSKRWVPRVERCEFNDRVTTLDSSQFLFLGLDRLHRRGAHPP